MEYERKNITLPTNLAKLLAEEKNGSAVVAEALEKHYAAKDAAKQLLVLAQTLDAWLVSVDERLDKLDHRLSRVVELAEGVGQSY